MIKLLPTKKSQLGSPRREAGFTLIELLIVIAIIVIIIALAAVSFATAQRTARDSVRKSDLKKIQSALERFYADNGSYPDEQGDSGPHRSSDYFTCSIKGDGSGAALIEGNPFKCGSNTYMSSIPADPISGVGYLYETNETPDQPQPPLPPNPYPRWCDNPNTSQPPAPAPRVLHGKCQKYTIWAKLENTNDPLVTATTNDPICQVAHYIEDWISGPGLNYCVHN